VFLSGEADIPSTVQAMKSGAVDFLTKPVACDQLLRSITAAVSRDLVVRAAREKQDSVASHLASLTPREREVMDLVVTGMLNKQIAARLGTAEKTIKVHRARAMEKMGATSLAELVRLTARPN
jgi:FixJ family two-component response regulator